MRPPFIYIFYYRIYKKKKEGHNMNDYDIDSTDRSLNDTILEITEEE